MRKLIGLVVFVMTVAGPAVAQSGADSHPGYYPIESMGLLNADDLEVNIDLAGPMLEAAAGALQQQDEDPDLSRLISQLERVRVQLGSAESSDSEHIVAAFESAVRAMEAAGWKRFLVVVDEDERVYLLGRQSGDLISGLTVLVHDGGDEVVLANVAGAIDPAVLGRVLSRIDELPNLSEFVEIKK
jgi:hypothetical protein